jgi:hypothetical protein
MRSIHVSMLVAAAATALAWGSTAMASSGQDPAGANTPGYPYSLAHCDRLPVSEKPICRVEAAGRSDHAAWQATPAQRQQSAAERQQLAAEQQRYQSAVAQCKTLTVSERNTCMSNAGLDERLNPTR